MQKPLKGEKTSTWRLFDDKDLQVGDEIIFVNNVTFKPFGEGVITKIVIRTLGTIQETDWEGHERFASEEEMYRIFQTFYNESVTPDTEVKLLWFSFTPITH